MTDRIADPWGERTPYARGAEWPQRIDEHVPGGAVDRWVASASVLHSNGDGIDIGVCDGRIAGVRGRAADRVNRGRLDPKDLYGWQANGSPDRLTRPLVRAGGRLVPASWDEAMGRIVERSRALLDGPGGWGRFGFYTTGQLFLEEYYTLGVIGKGGIGTPHMDGNTRLCTATAAAALKASFRLPTPTSTTATRSRSTGTTSPRRRRCSGCACSTAAAGPTRRACCASTRATRPSRARPTSTSRRGRARTSR